MIFPQHSWYIRWYYFKVGHKTSWVARNSRYSHNTNKFVLVRRQGNSRWQHNLPRDKDGISHEEFNRYLGRASKCWWWSWHICQENSWRCNQSAMILSQRNDEAKGYWNHEYDTNSKSSLLFKVKWYDKENRRKLSSSSKIVLREGPGSTVKI